MGLTNENEVHYVLLKLDKNKTRELELREYLDTSVSLGITRKEAILRMYEILKNNDFIKEHKLSL